MNEFKKAQDNIKKLALKLFGGYSSFHIYDKLVSLKAGNVVGDDEAQRNSATMNRYVDFFNQTIYAHKTTFLLVLSHFFDVSDKARSIIKMKNIISSQKRELTPEAFLASNPDRAFIESLAEGYEGVTAKDIKDIDELLKQNDGLINKLKDFRDTKLCHDDLREVKTPLTIGEAVELFKLAETIINKISERLSHESWMYGDSGSNEAERYTGLVIDHLNRFEPYRLKEIAEKYKKVKKRIS